MTKQAPIVFSTPLDQLDLPGQPERSAPDFEQYVLMQYSLKYAVAGCNAAVVIKDGKLYVVAVPDKAILPLQYLEGLCQHGYIEDALPGLAALYEMADDPAVAYTYGLALSELGRTEECLAPLNKALNLDPSYDNAAIAIGVALCKLERYEEAEIVLKASAKIQPDNPLVKQNLASTLARAGKLGEALPYFRQAAALDPNNPAVMMGLAKCLDSIPEHSKEATEAYKHVAKKFGGSQFGEAAKQILNRRGTADLRARVDGGTRPDAVEYMIAAIRRFKEMDPHKVGQAVLEIAKKGEQGLAINDPKVRYTLENLEGDFSGLQLLCYMHVGLKQFDPRADTGSGLDKEYEMARSLTQ